jgi:hypothetical protein
MNHRMRLTSSGMYLLRARIEEAGEAGCDTNWGGGLRHVSAAGTH